jgi:hypothetical protein
VALGKSTAAAEARLQEMGPLTAGEGVILYRTCAVTMPVGLWVSAKLHADSMTLISCAMHAVQVSEAI